MNNRELGSKYEDKAKTFLEALGMDFLEKNYRIKSGEIDLIMKDKGTIVFVEVKSRKNKKAGAALDAISYRKRMKIISVSKYYLLTKNRSIGTNVRYDCVGIDGEDIHYIRSAFDSIGNIT